MEARGGRRRPRVVQAIVLVNETDRVHDDGNWVEPFIACRRARPQTRAARLPRSLATSRVGEASVQARFLDPDGLFEDDDLKAR